MYCVNINSTKLRLRDVPSLETHAMKDHAKKVVDTRLYDKDPLMGPGGLFEQMTPVPEVVLDLEEV